MESGKVIGVEDKIPLSPVGRMFNGFIWRFE